MLALSNCVKWLPEVVQQKAMYAILPYLEHTTTNVRRTAVQALGKLPAADHISRLESAKILFCKQDLPVIERAILAIRNTSPNDKMDVLRKRIERLELRLGKIVSILGEK